MIETFASLVVGGVLYLGALVGLAFVATAIERACRRDERRRRR